MLFQWKKKQNIYKNEEEITQKISYILQFIESMTSSLSNFVHNLSEVIHRTIYKSGNGDKYVKPVESKYCDCFLE